MDLTVRMEHQAHKASEAHKARRANKGRRGNRARKGRPVQQVPLAKQEHKALGGMMDIRQSRAWTILPRRTLTRSWRLP